MKPEPKCKCKSGIAGHCKVVITFGEESIEVCQCTLERAAHELKARNRRSRREPGRDRPRKIKVRRRTLIGESTKARKSE